MTRPALLIALAVLGCTRERLAGKACAEDLDCGSPAEAHRCEPETGVCFCRTDEACPGSQFCNLAGFCQDRAGCEKNADCGSPELFCETTSGQCLPVGRCTSDLQCPLGEICEPRTSRCVPGCRRNGDCPQTSCRCGDVACTCTGTTPEELARCAVGVCDSRFCADKSFCRYGEQCGVRPDAGPRAQCYSDFDVERRPYCARCTSGPAVETCGLGPNYCIIDTRTASTYCGADCSQGQACPNGYGCRDIRVVFTRFQCSTDAQCPPDPSFPCSADPDCPFGGRCIKAAGAASGFCGGRCRLREGSSFGYCSCQADADCAAESCTQGQCSITRKPCIDGDPQACKRPPDAIRCVDFDGIGGCLIGQNCTPTAGLTCLEVQ